MVVATIRVQVPPKKRREMLQTLESLTESIRNQPGCLTYHFYVEIGDENSMCVVEEWSTLEDLEAHILSRDFSVLFGAIHLLQSPKNIDFVLLSPTGGLEVIDDVRTKRTVTELDTDTPM